MNNENRLNEELMSVERRAYYKEWRAKNKDKVKRHNQNFWRKRVELKAETLKGGDDNDS
jgi:hypothetical protein